MSWVTGAMVFFVIWWTVLFVALPLGVQRIEDPAPGVDRGAPQNPQLLRKALITTAITTVLWAVWYIGWVLDAFGFRAGG